MTNNKPDNDNEEVQEVGYDLGGDRPYFLPIGPDDRPDKLASAFNGFVKHLDTAQANKLIMRMEKHLTSDDFISSIIAYGFSIALRGIMQASNNLSRSEQIALGQIMLAYLANHSTTIQCNDNGSIKYDS